MRFIPKTIIVCFDKKAGFNYKNNYKYCKEVDVWLDIITKVNFKILINISYIFWELKSRKI